MTDAQPPDCGLFICFLLLKFVYMGREPLPAAAHDGERKRPPPLRVIFQVADVENNQIAEDERVSMEVKI